MREGPLTQDDFATHMHVLGEVINLRKALRKFGDTLPQLALREEFHKLTGDLGYFLKHIEVPRALMPRPQEEDILIL